MVFFVIGYCGVIVVFVCIVGSFVLGVIGLVCSGYF